MHEEGQNYDGGWEVLGAQDTIVYYEGKEQLSLRGDLTWHEQYLEKVIDAGEGETDPEPEVDPNEEFKLASGSGFGAKMVNRFIGWCERNVGLWSLDAAVGSMDPMDTGAVDGIISQVYNLFFGPAFALMCILWLISVAKSSVTFELYNKEQMVKPLLRLLWCVGLMSLSLPLLEFLFKFGARIGSMLRSQIHLENQSGALASMAREAPEWVDDSWIIGGLLTLLNIAMGFIKYLPQVLLDIVFCLVFYVIIAIRFVKLATLQCLSPFFFACAGSEKTDRYLQSFLKEYAVYALQIAVAMVIYAALSAVYSATNAGLFVGFVIYLAGMVTVASSGKFLRSLFN